MSSNIHSYKKEPVAIHLTSQRFNDVSVTKTGFCGFWMKISKMSNFCQKILGICNFDEVFGKSLYRKVVTTPLYPLL